MQVCLYVQNIHEFTWISDVKILQMDVYDHKYISHAANTDALNHCWKSLGWSHEIADTVLYSLLLNAAATLRAICKD